MQAIDEHDNPEISRLDPVEEVIAAVGRGEMVVVVDDEDRENEGDLICAADAVTPDMINFMATHGRGLICVTLPGSEVARLGIADMRHTGEEDVPVPTAFMESVDARHGISTGISSADRAHTARLMADAESTAGDLVRPGHMFPIKANHRGVLGRAGHTEASVDLATLSGRRPVGVICEIMKEDGSMARLEDLLTFADKHGLKISSVAALIEYRQQREGEVEFEGEITLPTACGEFQCRIYRSSLDEKEHLAVFVGDLTTGAPPLVRVHSECLTGDVLHSMRCDCGDQLQKCMRQIQEEGCGIILYMRQEGRGIGLGAKMRAYALQDQGLDTVEANLKLGFGADQREYRSSALILHDLGVDTIRLMTNNPAKVDGLNENGICIHERVPVRIESNPHNAKYLETKRTRLGHLL
ncbi:MAG: GTP cyclohydrolase II [Kiritimatiellae bacterium]|jgi:3,4-dihydroxy 2-butanone 4-phosphate synthase/GTP cyclohydrolase II|nr:GTP cyclohydrolase II [Kiritimatiellia bacterium]